MYRDFKKSNEQCFNNNHHNDLSSKSIKRYDSFQHIFQNTLNKHAAIKKKMLRANHAACLIKALRKITMKRSYLENLHFKTRTQELMIKYKRQIKFYRKTV